MLQKSISSFQNDGRISPKATEVTFDFLRKIDPALRDVKLDLAKTYEGSFIEKARDAWLGIVPTTPYLESNLLSEAGATEPQSAGSAME